MEPEAGAACADVTAVVVSYRPEPAQLDALVGILRRQVGRIVVVDNGSPAGALPATSADDAVQCLRNDENLGIGAAQNRGAQCALARRECAYILLLDQDSRPAPGMVRCLRAAFASAGGSERPLAAVGPWSVDPRTGARARLVLDGARGPRRWRPPAALAQPGAAGALPVEVAFLLASGTLLAAPALRALGGMRGDYFIDHVDTEWCLRARAAGWRLAAVPQAVLEHRLGDSVRRIWFFGWREVAWHAPLRDYYMFRNTLLLLRDIKPAQVWRRFLLWRLVLFAGYFLLWGDRRWQRARLMAQGLRDGIAGRAGRRGAAGCEPIAALELDPRSMRGRGQAQ